MPKSRDLTPIIDKIGYKRAFRYIFEKFLNRHFPEVDSTFLYYFWKNHYNDAIFKENSFFEYKNFKWIPKRLEKLDDYKKAYELMILEDSSFPFDKYYAFLRIMPASLYYYFGNTPENINLTLDDLMAYNILASSRNVNHSFNEGDSPELAEKGLFRDEEGYVHYVDGTGDIWHEWYSKQDNKVRERIRDLKKSI